MKFSKKALIFVAVFIVLFTVAVLCLNYGDHTVSDALIIGVYGLATGECGILAMLKRGKDKQN